MAIVQKPPLTKFSYEVFGGLSRCLCILEESGPSCSPKQYLDKKLKIVHLKDSTSK